MQSPSLKEKFDADALDFLTSDGQLQEVLATSRDIEAKRAKVWDVLLQDTDPKQKEDPADLLNKKIGRVTAMKHDLPKAVRIAVITFLQELKKKPEYQTKNTTKKTNKRTNRN